MQSHQFDLTGKVALITGASRGLGEGMAVALAEAGADCALVSRDAEGLEAVAAKVRRFGRKALVLPTDLSAVSAIGPMVERIVKGLGGVDILVNNAGTNVRRPAEEFTEADWDQVLALNLKSAFFCAQAVGRVMIERGTGGKIINTASLTSRLGISHVVAYAASKGGILSMTRSLALEWAPHRICVNAIAPGYFRTALTAPLFAQPERVAWMMSRTPMKRAGLPEDLGGAAVFLASAASDYITGQCLFVDGGWTAA